MYNRGKLRADRRESKKGNTTAAAATVERTSNKQDQSKQNLIMQSCNLVNTHRHIGK